MKRGLVLSLVATTLAVALPAGAVVDDPNFTETEVLDTSEPFTGLAWAPDGSNRLFLMKKEGLVQIIENGALLATPFATFTTIYPGSECGLIGIAFDPNFGQNHFVYFFISVSDHEQNIIRYTAQGNVGVDPTPIVTGLPTLGRNHDGGAIGFGPDGKLYWAIGDLGSNVGVDADLSSMAAKVGRVNRDGSVPDDNPFADGSGSNDERIWARGFRNPFTMTFQPGTGRLWLNVVGSYVEQIFMVGRGDHGGYVEYESFQPDGFLTPQISYRTNGADTYPLAGDGAVRSAGITTFTTASRNWFHPGERVTIRGVNDASFDGVVYVKERLSDATFTIEQAGPNASSGGGDATSPALGGCVTGGAFYDSTAASAEYRGNFFFGDLNSGLISRARLSGTNVLSVEPFASGHRDTVDIALGPDGDLYHVSHNGPGGVFRERFNATSQGIVVSPAHVQMLEEGVAAFHVRLALAPTGSVRIGVARVSGDADVSVTEGATLTFGASDWQTPQPVRLSAARDWDALDDATELRVTSAGLGAEQVSVRVIDEIVFDPPPGEGGAGGEAGADSGGSAGRATGGATGGGEGGEGALGGRPGTGGSPRGGAGGTTSGAAGMGDGDTGGGSGAGKSGSDDSGCGCSLKRPAGHGAGSLLILAWLLRRRPWQHRVKKR